MQLWLADECVRIVDTNREAMTDAQSREYFERCQRALANVPEDVAQVHYLRAAAFWNLERDGSSARSSIVRAIEFGGTGVVNVLRRELASAADGGSTLFSGLDLGDLVGDR